MYTDVLTAPRIFTLYVHVEKHSADAPTPRKSRFARFTGSASRSSPAWKSSTYMGTVMNSRP